ncbi:MAG: serpin family protein, partial [Rhodothermales bacterium]
MRFIVPIFVALSFISACSVAEPQDDDRRSPRQLTVAEQQLSEADNAFGFELFRSLSEASPENSVVVSPLSVSMALGMTLNGARGATRDSMKAALEVAGLTEAEINDAYRSLIDMLVGLDPEVNFDLANSIWYRDTFDVESDFVEVNKEFFDAEVTGLDFSSPEAPDRINDWVDSSTRGKIDKIVDRIDPVNMMYLVNAIYFKGAWTSEFDADDTQDAPFTRHDGTESVVPMMRQELFAAYTRGEDHAAVDLLYGDSLFSMAIVLPDSGVDVNTLAARFTETEWGALVGGLSREEVDLQLPRFEIEYEASLKSALSDLGMGVAFVPS